MDNLEFLKSFDVIPLFPALSQILKGHTRFFEEKLTGTNVTPSELPYILRIGAENNKITQKDLSKSFNVSEPVVARTLKNLENKGFVIRNKDPNNKTKRLLSLSPEGFEVSEKMRNIDKEWCEKLFKNVCESDIEKFNEIITLITINSMKIP